MQRAAVNEYLAAASEVGLFKGRQGRELRTRLRAKRPDAYRGAMAECTAAWWLSGGLGLQLAPRPPGRAQRVLELGIVHGGETFGVEVKAPFRPRRYIPGRAYIGPAQADHIGAVAACLGHAHHQFDPDKRNVVVRGAEPHFAATGAGEMGSA